MLGKSDSIKDPIKIDESMPFKLVRLANLFGKNFYQSQSKADYGLSLTEWRILMTLAYYRDITAIEVCYHTGYTEVNVSRALKRLQKAGIVSKIRDLNDRRRYMLGLTPTGISLYNKIKVVAEDSVSGLMASLSISQEKQLHRYIDLLVQTMLIKTLSK